MSETEGMVGGDIVKFEVDSRYSREICTVLASQTLAIGSVCQGGAAAKIAVAACYNAGQPDSWAYYSLKFPDYDH